MANSTDRHPLRHNAGDDLRLIALQQFSSVGFAGASLQQIADAAGYSKSSVLYHFASKEALLEEALTPAIARLREMVDQLAADPDRVRARARFIDDFIDFLLQFRLEVHTFINQGQSLRHVPVVDRAQGLIVRLADVLCDETASIEDRLRFGIALGGAAYTLVAGLTFFNDEIAPAADVRPALRAVVTELLAPVSVAGSSAPGTEN
ncbi:TetR/AcrR family transcriptional regulator [Cryobacterium tepidiphilum]|uniref:TetR/AcrR family transcriptional regulator n=1 Tax=Cryobacterium tepidiphilum TaxID=2486026 RepID=A0A3M8L3L3_9MICO|nr:TetR/AcrR family transcriptional regulator [Cryobacterium tepidiphilum]